jgi:ankyrin repeat protein
MQMSQCTPEAAKTFVSQIKSLINTPLTHSGQTLLMLSSSIASLNLVIAILNHKPNIKIKDNIGRSALHYAASVGNS